MAPLRFAEVVAPEEAPRLLRVVVEDGCLEVLALGRRLAQLAAQPAEEADRLLVDRLCHRRELSSLETVDTLLAIASRRDERRTLPQPLPEEVAARVLDAGRLSGSSRNAQPWTFVVPSGSERLERLAEAVYVPGNVLGAGLVVAIVVAGKGPVLFDAGRAAQSMLLAAWAEGIASCPNGIADVDRARDALDASPDETPVIVLTFGYPERSRDPERHTAAEWSARANRKPIEDVVRRIS